ncbi:exodeoxyribonuclease VII small subunit [Arthrobacter sp. AK01]|uniref:exodeoxyribonuclease VII small subunit n=1 Tax=Micrococcaceae TaxID=1268 RepID=UPI001E430EE8|nr:MULTISPECIES: exodeoxyribonuclease VII small subunit [Micrococcaceae]MCD4852850.1 exodeoxyribonuclease VII small subunit [Arthrobacter sp. AK01]MCP1414837.1 exodeoxyribonuclease VII small subunit [Paenarthrobacter sp. A20]
MTENTPADPSPESLDSLSYEEAREQLVSVVGRLEAGGATLEESLALWERGEALAKRCEDWLEGARKRLATARDAGNDAGAAASSG